MQKLSRNFVIVWLIGFLGSPAIADPVTDPGEPIETVVRINKDCPCEASWCLDRKMIDTMNTIIDSERDCRNDLLDCRKEKIDMVTPATGWDPGSVLLIAGAVVVAALAGGFVIGYSVK